MKRLLNYCMGVIVSIPLLASCGSQNKTAERPEAPIEPGNSIYHWKGTFAPDSTERAFLKAHDITRIYLRMFDVAIEPDYEIGTPDIVPIATTKFEAPVPAGVEIVPVTYITLEALRAMKGQEPEYASLIVERLLAMSSYNGCGTINEIQLDCDWTASTRGSYATLCQVVKNLLQREHIALSVTVRLHQLQEAAPPADRGVLMLYNTGALKEAETKNSILNIDDIIPYLKEKEYDIPLSYAYPAFGWGVKFKGGNFVSIVAENETPSSPDERIRVERPTAAEILAVKQRVERSLGKPAGGNIVYHLDYSQLKNYSYDEIDKILGR